MANPAWLESSLRRSGRLGLEVLERASGRCVDWSSTGAFQTPTTSDETTYPTVKRTHSELEDAFATIAAFMTQTTHHCKKYYECGRCNEPSDAEKTHVSRFHTRPGAGWTAALPTRKHSHVSSAKEDFYIEVSPGTYAITASLPESQQQTHLVSVNAGESIKLTFNL
uniref:A kinase (PRKA) interacting protein 1 n=1 Tax=Iconisemion striatum TaxID=60296 RepID=A0A1A7XVY8_9TELE